MGARDLLDLRRLQVDFSNCTVFIVDKVFLCDHFPVSADTTPRVVSLCEEHHANLLLRRYGFILSFTYMVLQKVTCLLGRWFTCLLLQSMLRTCCCTCCRVPLGTGSPHRVICLTFTNFGGGVELQLL